MLDYHGNSMFASILEEFNATNAHQALHRQDSDVPTGYVMRCCGLTVIGLRRPIKMLFR